MYMYVESPVKLNTTDKTFYKELDGFAVSVLGVRSRKLSNNARSSDG
jgi:hypothetical protein